MGRRRLRKSSVWARTQRGGAFELKGALVCNEEQHDLRETLTAWIESGERERRKTRRPIETVPYSTIGFIMRGNVIVASSTYIFINKICFYLIMNRIALPVYRKELPAAMGQVHL